MESVLSHMPIFIPELFMFFMACVALMSGVFFANCFGMMPYYVVQTALVITLAWCLHTFLTIAAPSTAFEHMFLLDRLAVVLKALICLFAFVAFVYAKGYNRARAIPTNEFYVLGLLSIVGMMVLVSAHHLLIIYLGLELFSLPIYAMIALRRGEGVCIEAAVKYFIIGTVASGFLLYGMSLLFGITHALDIQSIAAALSVGVASKQLLILSLVFLVSGVAFKLGVAPFHMWVPDVYDGAPTSVTVFIATISKLAAFALIIRLLNESLPIVHLQWQSLWVIMALFSIAVGNLGAIVQKNIKRLLAYSSIAHMGYMLLALSCATASGNAAALFYLSSYVLMTAGAFGVILLMSSGREGTFEANMLSDYSGLNDRHPWLAFIMLLLMFSMAGVPPIVGFIAKLGVLSVLLSLNHVALAVFAIVFAIIGAYYYIRVVKVMYFDPPAVGAQVVVCSRFQWAVLTLNSLLVLALGVFPGVIFYISQF